MTPQRRAYMLAYYRASERDRARRAAKRATPEHKAYMRAYKSRYRQANRERLRQQDAEYRARTRGRASEGQRRWRALNREHSNALAASRQRQTPPWADRAAIIAVYDRAAELTRTTGQPHEVDHVVPLRGRLVSGLHVAENLKVVHRAVNRAKSNKLLD